MYKVIKDIFDFDEEEGGTIKEMCLGNRVIEQSIVR